jgi:hypothetical protein
MGIKLIYYVDAKYCHMEALLCKYIMEPMEIFLACLN